MAEWDVECKENHGTSLVAHVVKNQPAMQETQVQSLGWEDPLEKGMTTHFFILAWRIPMTEQPGGLQSRVLQRVGHDWATNTLSRKPCVFPDDQGTASCCLLGARAWMISRVSKTKGPSHATLTLKVFRSRKQLLVYFLTYDGWIWCLALDKKKANKISGNNL